MVVADDPSHAGEEGQGREDSLAHERVAADDLELVGVERRRLGQDRVGHGDLADVVDDGSVAQVAHLVLLQAEHATDLHRELGDGARVLGRVGVLRLQRGGQGLRGAHWASAVVKAPRSAERSTSAPHSSSPTSMGTTSSAPTPGSRTSGPSAQAPPARAADRGVVRGTGREVPCLRRILPPLDVVINGQGAMTRSLLMLACAVSALAVAPAAAKAADPPLVP